VLGYDVSECSWFTEHWETAEHTDILHGPYTSPVHTQVLLIHNKYCQLTNDGEMY